MKVRFTKIQQLRNGVRRYGILGASRRIYWKIYRRAVGNRMPYKAAISEIWLQASGPIIIRGWSLGPNPIDSVSIILDGRVKVETKQRLIREDVRNNYPKYDDLYSGFTGTVSKGIQSLIGNSYEIDFYSGKKKVYHLSGLIPRPKKESTDNENDHRLKGFKDCHLGKSAILLGNGPSVRYEDLERMAGRIVLAANRFHLAYPQMKFRPTYTVCTDLLVLKKYGSKIAKCCETPLFISERAENSAELKADFDDVITFRETPVRPSPNPEDYYFSFDPVQIVGFGFGVIYIMIQLGIWMGVKEFFLYGIDHTFQLPKDYVQPGRLVTHQGEENHFIANYREMGEKWAPPNPDNINASFRAARQHCERHGIKIWNCTHGGKLEIFDRCSINDVLNSK